MSNRREFLKLSAGVSILGVKSENARGQCISASEQFASVSRLEIQETSLPKDYRKPGDMKWGWGTNDDGVLPDWVGGSGTKFEPKFVQWNNDGSATLSLDNTNGIWTAGELQINRPKRSILDRWGAVLSSDRPNGVCALFAFAENGTEIDFEWRGDHVWQLNLHLFDVMGNRVNPSVLPTVAAEVSKPHVYEFAMNSEACLWFIDGEEVARVTPKDMPGAIWNPGAKFGLFASIEHHGSWAKHNYDVLPATMRVHGLLV